MDKETAKVLMREGATFVLLDMPEGSEFGIDYNSWTTGPKFRGVKMIPPGIHFVYYRGPEEYSFIKNITFLIVPQIVSPEKVMLTKAPPQSTAQNSNGSSGLRTGFFYNFKQKEMLVKKWDKYNEDIQPGQVSTEEQNRLESNITELDQFLGPYPYESYKKWVSLTNHITDDLLQRLQPECGTIYSVAQFESPCSNSQSRLEAAEKLTDQEKTDGLPNLITVAGTEMKFSKIPKQRYPDGASPQEVTKHSMDSSFVLETMLKSDYSENIRGILGEIQFSFICFLIGQVYDAFDQWKKLVHLLCSSESALNSPGDLFMDFITVLHFQVYEIPEDFFVDIVSANNFLTSTLQEFFSNLDEGNGDTKLRQRGSKFREHLTKKFNWDFTTEPDDFAPVIVDT